LEVARDHLIKAEEITEDMKEVVKVLEEFLYGPQEDRPSTPRGSFETDTDPTASPRSSEKKKRSSVMEILKGMKERRTSVAQLKKTDKRNSKANIRTPEKASPRSGSLKFDESPSIKYYRQDEVVPLSPTRSGTFAYGASPYKDVDFNDLEAIERASDAAPTSPRRERSNSITVSLSPRRDEAKKTVPETITEQAEPISTETPAANTGGVQPIAANGDVEAPTTSSDNNATEPSDDVAQPAVAKESTKWRPVRTSSTGKSVSNSESMAGSYRNNPYFTFRNSMRDQLEEFEAMERNGETPDADIKFGKRAKEAPEARRTSLQLGSAGSNSVAADEEGKIPSPRSKPRQFQNIFATSKTEPVINTSNNNTNNNPAPEETPPIRASTGSVTVAKSSSTPTMRLSIDVEVKSSSKDKDKKEKKEKDKKAPTPRSGRTKLLFRNKSKKDKGDKLE
jgi:hypothetical protein